MTFLKHADNSIFKLTLSNAIFSDIKKFCWAINTANGLLPDPSKIHLIVNYTRPKDKAETKRFVAITNYYRRFIKKFATISKPLFELPQKRIDFKWNKQCKMAF